MKRWPWFILLTCIVILPVVFAQSVSLTYPSRLVLSPLTLDLKVGGTHRITAAVYDNLNKKTDKFPVAWVRPRQPEPCALVDDRGAVIAQHVGTCMIGALVATASHGVVLQEQPVTVNVK